MLLRSAKLEASDLAAVHDRLRDRRRGRRGDRRRRRLPARPRRLAADRARLARRASRSPPGERPGPAARSTGSTEVAALAASFNQLADDLDRAKDAERTFLLSVSHELKTPLAAIRGHGEALLDGVMTVPKAAGVVVAGVEAARAARPRPARPGAPEPALVLGAPARGRPDRRSSHRGRRAATGPSRCASASRSSARRTARSPAVADPDRALQVLSNLIENALRSTPSGGTVTVAAHPGELTVADTGPGPRRRTSSRTPSSASSSTAATRSNRAVGTGLGLAIVKELTEAMDGTISVKSVPGKGTVFTVRLPPGGEATGPIQRPPARATVPRSSDSL